MDIKLHNDDCFNVFPEIQDKSIDMIFCDLPYGTTQNRWDTILPLDKLWEAYKRIIKDNGAIVLTAQTPFDKVLGMSNIKWLKYEWIWQKSQGTGHLNAKKAPLKIHENVLVFYKSAPTYFPQCTSGKAYTYTASPESKFSTNYGKQREFTTTNTGFRYPVSVQKFKRDKDKIHPTQKPVALCEYMIRTYSREGETVLDNCMGAGSTGVACVNSNRNFIGIEKDENYFKIAKERIVRN